MTLVKAFLKIFLLLGFSMALFLPAWSDYPQRIISGIPSVTEMLFALGLGDRVVGVTTNDNYPPEVLKKEKIGGFFLNLEKIVSLKPDLLIMQEDAQKRDLDKIRRFGLKVLTVNPRNIDGVGDALITIGKTVGEERKARAVVYRLKTRLSSVAMRYAGQARPKLLVIVGYNPLIVAGGGTFIDDIIRKAGGDNAAADTRGAYPQLNFESLVKEDPAYIIIPEGTLKKGEIERDSRWRQLKARTMFINADILSRPGPRVVEAVEQIAGFIHEKNK